MSQLAEQANYSSYLRNKEAILKIPKYEIGQAVLIGYPKDGRENNTKLDFKWHGPHIVTQKISDYKYVVQDPVDPNITITRHIVLMRPYLSKYNNKIDSEVMDNFVMSHGHFWITKIQKIEWNEEAKAYQATCSIDGFQDEFEVQKIPIHVLILSEENKIKLKKYLKTNSTLKIVKEIMNLTKFTSRLGL